MIDWFNVFANSLWIFALSLALAVLSYARWEAIMKGVKLKDVLNRDRWQIAFNIAGAFFCGGLATTSDVHWEQVLWAILLVLFLVQIGMVLYAKRQFGKN